MPDLPNESSHICHASTMAGKGPVRYYPAQGINQLELRNSRIAISYDRWASLRSREKFIYPRSCGGGGGCFCYTCQQSID